MMSRAYTTTSQMTRTTAENHHLVVVVARDGPPSTSYHPVNDTVNFLSTPTKSERGQSYTGHQQTDLTQARRRGERPPPLLPIKTIPLPALADIPISVNPVLSYTPSKIVLEYNLTLPPSTARPPPNSRREWRRQPAMDPSTVGSMTIKVPGLERLVVVFPSTLGNAVVTVDDVLIAVHRAAQASGIGAHVGFGTKYDQRTILGSSPRNLAPRVAYEHTTIATQEHGGGDHWWAGLYPCPKERDVWILRTRKISNR